MRAHTWHSRSLRRAPAALNADFQAGDRGQQLRHRDPLRQRLGVLGDHRDQQVRHGVDRGAVICGEEARRAAAEHRQAVEPAATLADDQRAPCQTLVEDQLAPEALIADLLGGQARDGGLVAAKPALQVRVGGVLAPELVSVASRVVARHLATVCACEAQHVEVVLAEAEQHAVLRADGRAELAQQRGREHGVPDCIERWWEGKSCDHGRDALCGERLRPERGKACSRSRGQISRARRAMMAHRSTAKTGDRHGLDTDIDKPPAVADGRCGLRGGRSVAGTRAGQCRQQRSANRRAVRGRRRFGRHCTARRRRPARSAAGNGDRGEPRRRRRQHRSRVGGEGRARRPHAAVHSAKPDHDRAPAGAKAGLRGRQGFRTGRHRREDAAAAAGECFGAGELDGRAGRPLQGQAQLAVLRLAEPRVRVHHRAAGARNGLVGDGRSLSGQCTGAHRPARWPDPGAAVVGRRR